VDNTLLQPRVTPNKAGGSAYSYSAKEQLAQYAATGFFGSTYYTTATEQLDDIKKLCEQLDSRFIAQAATYARQQGKLKDMPAYLLAVLAARQAPEFTRAFAHVIDNGRMLRNFVQILRSGITGRKSFGTRPRRAIEGWLNKRHPMALLRDSIGETPSLSYIIRTIRPSTLSETQRAMYGYLIGDETKLCTPRTKSGEIDKVMLWAITERQKKHGLPYILDEHAGTIITTKYDATKLPEEVKRFEAWKKTREGVVPDVDFRMLDSMNLSDDEWAEVASRASWTMTIKNLNTFRRHGVFDKQAMVELIAERLADKNLVQKAKTFPYQIMSAFKAVSDLSKAPDVWRFSAPTADTDTPPSIVAALEQAMEHALENVPYLDGNVALCLDVSGSMSSPITGNRPGQTTKVRYVDAAALFTAALVKRSKKSIVLPFDTRCFVAEVTKEASVMNFATRLAQLGGGGTQCELPLIELNKRKLNPDIVIFVSDNESWAGHYYSNTTGMMAEWAKLKARSPKSKLVCIDIAAMTSTQATSAPDRLNVGGFSDAVFDVVANFLSGNAKNWVGVIEAVEL